MKSYDNKLSKKNMENAKSQNTDISGCISNDVKTNLKTISDTLCKASGLIIGEFDVFNSTIGIVYLKALSDKDFINKYILEPLLDSKSQNMTIENELLADHIRRNCIRTADVQEANELQFLINEILMGNTVLFIQNSSIALCIDSRKLEKRAIESPKNETNLLGSKDSFCEDIDANCSLLIRRLSTSSLRLQEASVGKVSKTKVKFLWVDGIANDDLVDEIKKRLEKINIDIITDIGQLAEIIEDKPFSIYPKYLQTERPDYSVMLLSEGRVVALCDGSPFAMIMPITFWDFFKSMDDYNDTPISASFSRIIRYMSFFISMFISPLYLCFVTYNHIIVPPELALSFATGRENVPYPTIVELVLTTFVLNIVKEAGLRMPGMFGYFAGTLTAVIIGQAAVAAGYVSASLIIIISISAITSFSISNITLVNTSRIINYILIICSGFFGIFGFFCGIILLIAYISRVSSFSVPYLYPILPFDTAGAKDTILRTPLAFLRKRPKLFSTKNQTKIRLKIIKSKGDINGR